MTDAARKSKKPQLTEKNSQPTAIRNEKAFAPAGALPFLFSHTRGAGRIKTAKNFLFQNSIVSLLKFLKTRSFIQVQ
jgi:hypothetical protein